MIEISKDKTFHLRGKSYSYVMRVDGSGYLEHVYFGARVGEDDLSYLNAPSFLSFSPIPPDAYDPAFSLDHTPQEYASFGQGDFRTPSVLARRADGDVASRFRYLSHAVGDEEGESCLPKARGGETLAVTLKDALSGVTVCLRYTVYEDCDVLVRSAEIVNGGEEPVRLERAYSFSVDLPAGEYDVLRLHGRHLAERAYERTPLGHGTVRICSTRGASSHQMNPFLALLSRNADEDGGECFGFTLLYSGSYALEAEKSQTDAVRVQGGVGDTAFSWTLGAGERFTAPQAALIYSASGLGTLSREAHDFLRRRVIPVQSANRPIVVNNWEATYFDFDRQKLFALIGEAADLGIDTFVLDDGWFGKRDGDASGLGDWSVNTQKLEGGLKPLIDACKRRGMKFGLWFEPEMVSEDSDLFRAHPDWAVGKADVPRCKSRNQYVLDFTRPEIVDHVYARMADILAANEISYVKWDMNRHITEFFSPALPAERMGEFSHRYILGVYTLAKRLRERFPQVFFEGCSGGGGRFDAGMLAYFPQIWTSDDTDAAERAKIQWATSFVYPISAMSCHVSACPNHQTGRVTPLSTRAALASLGPTGYELDLGKLSDGEKGEVRKQIAAYRETEALIMEGDLYRLSDPFRETVFAEMVVSKDKKSAYLVGMTMRAVPADFNRRIRLKGLDENRAYHVRELGLTLHGSTLMRAGLLLPKQQEYESWTWHLES